MCFRVVVFVFSLTTYVLANTLEESSFFQWCNSQGITHSSKLEIRNSETFGRSIVLNDYISVGSEILFVPKEAFVTPQKARTYLHSKGLPTSEIEQLSNLDSMALLLISEGSNTKSYWKPYFGSSTNFCGIISFQIFFLRLFLSQFIGTHHNFYINLIHLKE